MGLFIRAASVFLGGKKIGVANKGGLDTASNGTPVTGDGGVWLGWAKGATQNTLNIDFSVPFAGSIEIQKIREALETGAAVKIQVGVINGKIESAEMFVDTCKMEWDHEKGLCTGSASLKSGATNST